MGVRRSVRRGCSVSRSVSIACPFDADVASSHSFDHVASVYYHPRPMIAFGPRVEVVLPLPAVSFGGFLRPVTPARGECGGRRQPVGASRIRVPGRSIPDRVQDPLTHRSGFVEGGTVRARFRGRAGRGLASSAGCRSSGRPPSNRRRPPSVRCRFCLYVRAARERRYGALTRRLIRRWPEPTPLDASGATAESSARRGLP